MLPAEEEGVEPTRDKVRLRRCPDCGKQVSRRAKQCPHCRVPLILGSKEPDKPKKPTEPRCYLWFELVVFATALLGLLGSAVCAILPIVLGANSNEVQQGVVLGVVGFFGTAWSSLFAFVFLDAARKLRSIDARLKEQSRDSSIGEV